MFTPLYGKYDIISIEDLDGWRDIKLPGYTDKVHQKVAMIIVTYSFKCLSSWGLVGGCIIK